VGAWFKLEAVRSRGQTGWPGAICRIFCALFSEFGGARLPASRASLILRLTGRSALPFLVYGRAALPRRQFVSAATDGRL